jgi:hypothetical protein
MTVKGAECGFKYVLNEELQNTFQQWYPKFDRDVDQQKQAA